MGGLLVNIDVPDLACAVDFYTQAFDLSVRRRFGAQGVELAGFAVPLFLLCKDAGTKGAPGSMRSYERHWTPVHLDVLVDDLDAAVKRAVAAGARVERSGRSAIWGKCAVLADPFGHGLCLIQFLNRGYDEIADPAE